MNNKELRELQLLELKIVKEIKRICEKHHIKYFLIGGTFLGAVRHQGFIPWDDDLDIGMVRSEYNKFLEIAQVELGKEFFFQTWDTDKDYPFYFGKIRLNGTEVQEKMNMGSNSHKGIFVDIFPYDNVPDSEKLQKRQRIETFYYRKLMWIKKGYGKELQKENIKMWLKYNIGRCLALFCNYDKLKKKYYESLTRYNVQDTIKLFDACYSYKKSQIERIWIEDLIEYQFEDTVFPAPQNYDAFLSNQFGDYMKLPPLEKRHTHEIQKIIIF